MHRHFQGSWKSPVGSRDHLHHTIEHDMPCCGAEREGGQAWDEELSARLIEHQEEPQETLRTRVASRT